MPTDLTVKEFWGAIVVQRDEGDLQRRWWFDTTDDGGLVFTSRVDSSDVFEQRTYHDADDISVPRSVVETLTDEGFDAGIFSSDAERYWTADEMRSMGGA